MQSITLTTRIIETRAMQTPSRLLWAAACSEVSRARALAEQIQGTVYADLRPDPSKLPFAALTTGACEDLSEVSTYADLGLYLVCERTIKAGCANVFGLFPMIAHPELTHRAADDHWRDKHGPLALEQHAYMTEYLQLSVVETRHGPNFDGFALCGFDNEVDLRERFFSEPNGAQIIAADVAKFADTQRSPRRLIAVPTRF